MLFFRRTSEEHGSTPVQTKEVQHLKYLRGRRIGGGGEMGGEGREKWEGMEGEMGGEGWERMGWEKDWAYHNIQSRSEYI